MKEIHSSQAFLIPFKFYNDYYLACRMYGVIKDCALINSVWESDCTVEALTYGLCAQLEEYDPGAYKYAVFYYEPDRMVIEIDFAYTDDTRSLLFHAYSSVN